MFDEGVIFLSFYDVSPISCFIRNVKICLYILGWPKNIDKQMHINEYWSYGLKSGEIKVCI